MCMQPMLMTLSSQVCQDLTGILMIEVVATEVDNSSLPFLQLINFE